MAVGVVSEGALHLPLPILGQHREVSISVLFVLGQMVKQSSLPIPPLPIVVKLV